MRSSRTAEAREAGLTPDSQGDRDMELAGARQPIGQTSFPLAETARFRQGVYRLLAGLLLYPVAGRLDAALEGAREIDLQSKCLADPGPYSGWMLLLGALESAVGKDLLEVQNEYVRLFVAGSGGVPCSPYESVYSNRQGYSAGWAMAHLDQEYASAGLGLAPNLSEMPDHAAVELEFMSFLCRQAADAWERGADREAAQVTAWQASFLDRHLARWFPEWAGGVAESDDEGTYSVVAVTARAFIDLDRRLIGRFLDEYREMPEPGQLDAPARRLKKRHSLGTRRCRIGQA